MFDNRLEAGCFDVDRNPTQNTCILCINPHYRLPFRLPKFHILYAKIGFPRQTYGVLQVAIENSGGIEICLI
jgi:hypothetical protein